MNLNELKNNYTDIINGYNLYFTDYPFKSLNITPIIKDERGLFEFICFEGSGRWLLSMYKTSYYTNSVYGTELYEKEATVENVIKWIDKTLLSLHETLCKWYNNQKKE